MRLLYLGPFNSPHLEDLALAMKERGHEVAAGGEVWSGLPESSLPAQGVRAEEMTKPMVLWLRRFHRDFRPDVVHTHWMPFATLAALAGARPFIASAWGSDVYGASTKHRLMIRFALLRAAAVTSDSADLLERVHELGPRTLRTLLVNWGVDLQAFRPGDRSAAKARFGLGEGPVVLSPRGLKEIYNPEVVVESFARVREAVPDAQLVLKHGGTEELLRPEWRDATGVEVIGRLEYGKLAELFRAAEVTVSIPRSDSSPRSVWEAMASGSATVLSDLPWTHELIADGRDALIVQAEPQAVTAAVLRLLQGDGLRERIASSARELVEQHRDREVELARLEQLYREVAGA
ncbi:MAG: glycosyltransferase family 4 protein [Gaiellaceae bacterium]